MKFKDYSLAVKLRIEVASAITDYSDCNKIYRSQQLRSLLTKVLAFKQYEVSYQLMKILFYSKNKYQSIDLDQMVQYILEKYIGQNMVNRYSVSHGYARKEEKIMTRGEFADTIIMGLEFLSLLDGQNVRHSLQLIFDQLDIKQTGTITNQDFATFLRYYMGSESPMSVNPTKRVVTIAESNQIIPSSHSIGSSSGKENQQISISPIKISVVHTSHHHSLTNKQITAKSLSNKSINFKNSLQQFRDLIIDQITLKCEQYDENADGLMTKKQIQNFLYNIVQLQYNSIHFISSNYFNFIENSAIPISQVVQAICQVHFRQIMCTLIKNQMQITASNKIIMNLEFFKKKILENCYFFNNKPSENLIQKVFQELKQKSEHKYSESISLEDFQSFILVYCCHNKLIFRHQQSKKTTNYLLNAPTSIKEADNSHCQEDESELNEIKVKQHSASEQSISKKETSFKKNQDQIGLSSNKKSKIINLQDGSYRNSYEHINEPILGLQTNSVKEISLEQDFSSKQKNNESQFIKPIVGVLSKQNEPLQQKQQDYSNKSEFKLDFKDILWRELQTIINKYSLTHVGYITNDELVSFIRKQQLLGQDRQIIIQKMVKLFKKQKEISIDFVIGFIIHMKGQEALVKFSKTQIKGKSTLNQQEISQILESAFGLLIPNRKTFSDFSALLFSQNTKSSLSYKHYLQLIGRNFSLRNTF